MPKLSHHEAMPHKPQPLQFQGVEVVHSSVWTILLVMHCQSASYFIHFKYRLHSLLLLLFFPFLASFHCVLYNVSFSWVAFCVCLLFSFSLPPATCSLFLSFSWYYYFNLFLYNFSFLSSPISFLPLPIPHFFNLSYQYPLHPPDHNDFFAYQNQMDWERKGGFLINSSGEKWFLDDPWDTGDQVDVMAVWATSIMILTQRGGQVNMYY